MSSPRIALPLGFVLVLGSFDGRTRRILSDLKIAISRAYGGTGVYPVVLDEVEAYNLGGTLVIAEIVSRRRANLYLFGEDRAPIEAFQYKGGLDRERIQLFLLDQLDPELLPSPSTMVLQPLPVSMKLKLFFEASLSILVIRHRHETRGGEVAELMHALMMGYGNKVCVVKREGFPLSEMILEFLDEYRVQLRTYNGLRDLQVTVNRLISHTISLDEV